MIVRSAFLAALQILIAAGYASAQPALPGSLDASFVPALNSNAVVYAIALQTNGQIIIGGTFTSIGGIGITNLARLNTDGTLDATFNPGRAVDKGYVSALAVQPDGKVLAGGQFSSSDFSTPANLARLNTNGTVDTGFYSGLFVDAAVNAVVIQTNGGILIGGAFQMVGGYVRRSLARLFPNGSLDTTFDACVAASAGAGATGLALQTDGNILASGNFGFSTGAYRFGIARLSACGELDTNYATQIGMNSNATAFTLALPASGFAFLGGNFSTYDLTNSIGVVQLNGSGLVSANFRPLSGINPGGTNFTIAVQPDGKIVIGGEFTTYDGSTRHRIARINSNGLLDPQFDAGIGPDNSVSFMAIQGDGKILVAGKFTSVSGSLRSGLARLNGDQARSSLSQPTLLGDGQFQLIFKGVAQVHYALEASSNLSQWSAITNFTGTTNPMTLFDPVAQYYSNRFYRAVSLP
jgi:uncharacterized delta-60 repeat protein